MLLVQIMEIAKLGRLLLSVFYDLIRSVLPAYFQLRLPVLWLMMRIQLPLCRN